MGQYYNPQIATSGLIACFDFGNVRSYSGAGITFNNIVTPSFGGTFVNSPTYSSNNAGYLTFAQSSSQYGIFPDFGRALTSFTLEAWFYLNSLPAINTVQALITQQFTGSNVINFTLGFNGVDGTGAYDGKVNGGFWNGSWKLTAGFTPVINVWYYTAITYDGTTLNQYKDGDLLNSKSTTATLTSGSTFNYLMRRWDDTNFVDGRLSIARIYDRALSATEIKENYLANKGRYGA